MPHSSGKTVAEVFAREFSRRRRVGVARNLFFHHSIIPFPHHPVFGSRIRGQKPEQNIDSQNHRAGTPQEKPGTIPHVPQHNTQQRSFIRRQFHDQHRRFAFEQGFFEQPGHQQRHHCAEQIHRQHRQPLQLQPAKDFYVGNARRNQQCVDRQSRRTTHQGRDQNRHQPVLGRFNRARGHDAGNCARVRTQHRDETFAVQPDLAHQPIHQKRRARHVTRVFQKTDEQKQQQDLRQKNNHRADTRNHTVHQQ